MNDPKVDFYSILSYFLIFSKTDLRFDAKHHNN